MLQILFKVLNLRKSLHFNHPTRKNLENITNTIISYNDSCTRILVQILSLFTKCKCSSKLSFLSLICVLFFRWSTQIILQEHFLLPCKYLSLFDYLISLVELITLNYVSSRAFFSSSERFKWWVKRKIQ